MGELKKGPALVFASYLGVRDWREKRKQGKRSLCLKKREGGPTTTANQIRYQKL